MKSAFFASMICICAAHAQYVIDWSTMDGGGGSGNAGSFAMQGTLGQPDATTGTAGTVLFRGGYWSLLDEALPLLRIFRADANVVLACPIPRPASSCKPRPIWSSAIGS